MNIADFESVALDKNGRYYSRTDRSSFEKRGLLEVYEWFLRESSFMPPDLSLYQRYAFYKEGYTKEFPKCFCGKPCGFMDRKPSKFCSHRCAQRSPHKLETTSLVIRDRRLSIDIKRKQTMFEKYGVYTNSQRPDIKKKLADRLKISQDAKERLMDSNWLFEQYVTLDRSSTEIAQELGVYYGTVLDHCRKHGFEIKNRVNVSKEERTIIGLLENNGHAFKHGDRQLIYPYEVDIIIGNLGIEIDGLFWHSSPKRDRWYHLGKTNRIMNKGLSCIHILDSECDDETIHGFILDRIGGKLNWHGIEKREDGLLSVDRRFHDLPEMQRHGFSLVDIEPPKQVRHDGYSVAENGELIYWDCGRLIME